MNEGEFPECKGGILPLFDAGDPEESKVKNVIQLGPVLMALRAAPLHQGCHHDN